MITGDYVGRPGARGNGFERGEREVRGRPHSERGGSWWWDRPRQVGRVWGEGAAELWAWLTGLL